jgi:hypothetical protein
MADLPRYQSTGRVYSDLPQLDFANVRESFKQSQSLSNQLDRLSTYAFKEMGKQTETQAAQFAVDNQLTIDQVREASKSGIKPEDLIKASGGGEIWQATISKIQGEQLRSQLEVLGKQALLDLQTQVDTNQISDMSEVKAKQEAIVNGMRKTLSFAPDSVLRFDATMGSVTSALYKEAQDKLVKDYKLGEQSKSLVNSDNSLRAYQAMLNHEDIKDPAMLREIEYALADQFERQSAGGGSDFALAEKNKFIKNMQDAKFNHLTKLAASPAFAKDASEAIVKLSKGDFKVDDANDYSAIYAQETPENQAKIRSYVRQQFIDINTTNNEIEKEKVDKLKAQANEIELEYYRTKNPKLLKDLVQISKDSEGKAISANTIESIKKSGAEKEGDVQYTDNVIKLKDEIKKGRFDSIDALYARGANLGVSRRTINQYVAPSYLSKSDALLDEVISNGASMLTPSGSTASKVRKQQELHQETDRLYDLQDTTKPIKSKAEISAELIDKKIKGNSAKSSQVTELNNMASAYGLQFTSVSKLDELTEQNIDRLIADKAARKSIKDKLRALGN